MVNKAKQRQVTPIKSSEQRQVGEQKQPFSVIPFKNFWLQALVIVIFGFALYSNTFDGEYALDDGIVIEQNQYVQCGFDSIDDILSKDAYHSFYKQMGSTQQLSGGRYRPLSIVTFAIEQDIFTDSTAANGFKIPSAALVKSMPEGKTFNYYLANIRHIINVVLYVISIVVLFYFLRNFIFKTKPDIAFFTALLFLAHPIHTEVVANVKSRDEILSFLFIVLTFIFVFRYVEKKKIADISIGMFFYFLAFLSKEYAIVLIALVPVSVFIFYKKSVFECAKIAFPLVLIFIVYFVCRVNSLANSNGTRNLSFGKRLEETNKHIENPEVLNNPYVFANEKQKWATKVSTVSNYFKLLILPHPLSSDYSYNQIPYKNWGHYSVWLSLILHIGLIIYGWKFILKRHILGFAIFTYLVYLSMVGNILMDIGATMGERLIYHSSLGFCIALAWVIFEMVSKMNTAILLKRVMVFSVFALILGLYSFKTVTRNEDWKSDITLFTKDVETVPNSVLANGNAGARCIDMADMKLLLTMKDGSLEIERASETFDLILGFNSKKMEGVAFYNYIVNEDHGKIKEILQKKAPQTSVELNTICKNSNMKSQKYLAVHNVELHPKSAEESIKLIWTFSFANGKWTASTDNRKEYLEKAGEYLNKALTLHPKYVNGYLNLGLANFKLDKLEESEAAWGMARKYFPNNPYLRQFLPLLSQKLLERGFKRASQKDFMGALSDVERAAQTDPGNFMTLYHLGGAYYSVGNYSKAYESWQKCLQLNPNYEEAKKGIIALQPLVKK